MIGGGPSVGSSLYSHIHQGGYESDSGVVERRGLCSHCCQPIKDDSKFAHASLVETGVVWTLKKGRRFQDTSKLVLEYFYM